MHRAHRLLQYSDNYLCTTRLQTTVQLLLNCCSLQLTSNIYRRLMSSTSIVVFFFLYKIHIKRIRCVFYTGSVFLNFWINFSRPSVVIGSTLFFHKIECPEFLQSYWCTVIVLVKKTYKQIAILYWDSHNELLRHEIRKSRVLDVFITAAMNLVRDRYFHLNILKFTVPSVYKILNFFFLFHTLSPFFNNFLFKFDVIRISGSFFKALWILKFNYNPLYYPFTLRIIWRYHWNSISTTVLYLFILS